MIIEKLPAIPLVIEGKQPPGSQSPDFRGRSCWWNGAFPALPQTNLLPTPGQFAANPVWIAAQVQHGQDLRRGFRFVIINPEGKAMRQHPIQTKMAGVDSVIKRQTFDVSHE